MRVVCCGVNTVFCCSFLKFDFARFCCDIAILVKTSQNGLLWKKIFSSFFVPHRRYLQDMLQSDRYCK